MRRASSLLAIGVSLLLSGVALAEAPGRAVGQQCDEPFTELFQRSYSGVQEARLEVIDNELDWCALWDEAYETLFPAPACDLESVDFDHEVVIVAALGPRPSSCYSVGIPCVQALGQSGNVRAWITAVVPDETCGCGAAITNPVVAVKIERPVGHVRYRQRVATLSCP